MLNGQECREAYDIPEEEEPKFVLNREDKLRLCYACKKKKVTHYPIRIISIDESRETACIALCFSCYKILQNLVKEGYLKTVELY